MILGPKYKIARRLNATVFEKTQTQKYALSQTRKKKGEGRGGPKTDFGIQLQEKQKARFTYILSEKQFSKYVGQALAKKGVNQQEVLFKILESRLDNAVVRAGIAPTRLAARQLVSHGHILVNGKKVSIPSYSVRMGDKISIREASTKKPVFATLEEKLKKANPPAWLKVDAEKKIVEVQGAPKLNPDELLFDVGQVLEFYSR